MSAQAAPVWRVPLFTPDLGPADLEAVQRPLRDGWLTMGPQVERLEEVWKKQTGARHAFAVTNGTAALHLAVLAAGIGAGDEVLCPTLTFVATANAARYVGAEPVFVESRGPEDLNLDPEDCARRITPRTRAILVVHYGGFPADVAALGDLARAHDLVLVEDAAHAVFSRVEGGPGERLCGAVGRTAAFSLFTNKNLTCGEGGVVTTDDDEAASRIRLCRSHGMTSLTLDRHRGRAVSYDVVALGYNYRLDEIRASLALAQLERLPALLAARQRLFQAYRERLRSLPVELPFAGRVPPGPPLEADAPAATVGIHILPVLLPEGTDRSAVMERLKAKGVQSSVHYPPVHLFSAYRNRRPGTSLPRTEALAARQLTLPFYPSMTLQQVDLVVESLALALRP